MKSYHLNPLESARRKSKKDDGRGIRERIKQLEKLWEQSHEKILYVRGELKKPQFHSPEQMKIFRLFLKKLRIDKKELQIKLDQIKGA